MPRDSKRTAEAPAIVDVTELNMRAEPSRDTTPPPIVPRGRLVCVVGEQVGHVHHLRDEPVVIGRAGDCDIRITSGTDVSRYHARIVWAIDHYEIEDMGSRNGISVNGLPIRRRGLSVGDRIQIAASVLFVFAAHDELEQRALRLQRLEALGQVTSGVVHDFRNVLTVIQANAQLLSALLDQLGVQHPEAAQSIADIVESADRGTHLVQRLLYFARRNDSAGWAKVDLGALIGEASGLVARTLKGLSPIKVEVDVAALGSIRGNAEELHQVMLNLCLNARDAMPMGGRLIIRGRRRTIDRAEGLHEHVSFSGPCCEITITDTGTGMDDATMARVFEPFFTTKPPGLGTGLGLSSAFGVVRNHGGNIVVESRLGHGSSFRILLPANGD